MKTNSVFAILTLALLSGCSTVHEIDVIKNEASSEKEQTNNLAEKTSVWIGEPVVIESVKAGYTQTDFVAITKKGQKLPCFYTSFFGEKISSIVCGRQRYVKLNMANAE